MTAHATAEVEAPVEAAMPSLIGASVAHCGDVAGLQAAAVQAVGLLRSLANPERLILMCALAEGERCVMELSQATGIQQPTLSQQLGVLRDEGLVSTRRAGKFVYYQVDSPAALELLALLHRLYCAPSASEVRSLRG